MALTTLDATAALIVIDLQKGIVDLRAEMRKAHLSPLIQLH